MTHLAGEAKRLLGAGADAACVVLLLPWVELGTRLTGPRVLVAVARRIGRHAPERSKEGRARLHRVVAGIDGRLSRRSKCYRRALIEMTLDRGAAREKLHLGLYARGDEGSGHAWLDAEGPAREAFDVVLEL